MEYYAGIGIKSGFEQEDLTMNGKSSGYVNCYKAIEGAILENPIVYQPFTVYFDRKQLDDIKDKYGADLFKECYTDVKKKHGFE